MKKDESNLGFWQRSASLYTLIQERSNRRLYNELVGRIEPYITKDSEVLELACGTGQLTIALHDKAGMWIATDFSPRMVEETGRRIPAVRAEVQDATQLTYEAASFDIVIIANALHIMPYPDKALKEIRRVLRPDGILIAPTFIYEGRINKLRLALMKAAGFQTFHKWKKQEYLDYIKGNGFLVQDYFIIPGSPLPECTAIAKPV